MIAAKKMGDISRDLESAGVSNLTRAADAEIAAERLAALSDVVGAAGELDMAEGAELLATSEDVGTLSAVVGQRVEDSLGFPPGLNQAILS